MGIEKKPLRLGVNTLFLVPGDVGGTETFLRETLKALATGAETVELVLFTTRDNDALLRKDLGHYGNVHFRKLNFSARKRPLRILLEQTLLPAVCRNAQLDCLWSPGYTAPLWAPCPQAVTIPDLQYKSHPEDMSWIERCALDLLVKTACRVSRRIFAISEFSKREIVKYGFAQTEKVEAVLLGVDPSFGMIHPDDERNEALRELLPLDVPYILCVAHSYPHKNIHLLVDAFNQLLDVIPHNLVVVGKPRRGEDALADSLTRLKDKGRVLRYQGLPYKTLQMLYQGADIFALPSSYEGFGLPVIEAMMAGVPVVISRQGSLPEVGGTYAYYVDMLTAEDIARTIKKVAGLSTDERREKIVQAKQWAGSFSWRRSAEKLQGAIQQVVSERQSDGRRYQ